MFKDGQVRQRAVIVVLGALLAAVFALGGLAVVRPTYTATGSVLLFPGEKSIPEDGNPFLYLGGVAQARDVLVKIINSDAVRTEVLADQDLNYEVVGDFATGAPILQVTTQGAEPEGVLALRDAVLQQIPRELERFQTEADTPKKSRISSMVLVDDAKAEKVSKSQIRAVVVAVGAAAALTFGALAGMQALARRRRFKPAADVVDQDARSASLRHESRGVALTTDSFPPLPAGGADSGRGGSAGHERIDRETEAADSVGIDRQLGRPQVNRWVVSRDTPVGR